MRLMLRRNEGTTAHWLYYDKAVRSPGVMDADGLVALTRAVRALVADTAAHGRALQVELTPTNDVPYADVYAALAVLRDTGVDRILLASLAVPRKGR